MPAVHAEKVRLIDWIHCFLGLISCNSDGKNVYAPKTVGSSSHDFSKANFPGVNGVKPFENCGGSFAIDSLSILGCRNDELPCAIPYDDAAQITLTYVPTKPDPSDLSNLDINITLSSLETQDQISNHRAKNSEIAKRATSNGKDDDPLTLTTTMEFGQDMVGQEVSVRLEVFDESELIICAAMGVGVTDGKDKSTSEGTGGNLPGGRRVQQPLIEEEL